MVLHGLRRYSPNCVANRPGPKGRKSIYMVFWKHYGNRRNFDGNLWSKSIHKIDDQLTLLTFTMGKTVQKNDENVKTLIYRKSG
jgi:hypothetical protein